ncbi:MAG: formyltetrahydrofolate deformylase [Actinomycetota bacterium]
MESLLTVERRLLLSCPDRPGIVAVVSGLLADCAANITSLDEHAEPANGRFAMRVAYTLPSARAQEAQSRIEAQLDGEDIQLSFSDPATLPRVAVLCSSENHCLTDLLWRFASDELRGSLVCVISTSDEHRTGVAAAGVHYHHLPVASRDEMFAHEEQLLELLVGKVDLVILARYMRILSEQFLDAVSCPAINIHHGFLPAFKGGRPYEQAHERGVKLIGATAHYVTAELDEGPIIEQDVVRVSHRDSSDDLRRVGRDVERVVLARAVRAHLEDRVVRWDKRALVF